MQVGDFEILWPQGNLYAYLLEKCGTYQPRECLSHGGLSSCVFPRLWLIGVMVPDTISGYSLSSVVYLVRPLFRSSARAQCILLICCRI